eukprot:TRINITY_DN34332_c0_g1_i1.p1 TRINITY_DN34332_c0_g1~~TRINITY_DN34332_c0_g1_i1.p1  ORF type:complete len:264 (-),score=26.66 TRINITY_DN34332_c0_g1_i1:397-1149(-)
MLPEMLLSPTETLLFVAYMICATTVQTMVGFGGGLIIMPLGMQLLPGADVMAAILAPNQVNNVFVVWKDRHHIQKDILFFQVLPWMASGLALGFCLQSVLTGTELKTGLGVFIIVASFSKLYELFVASDSSKAPPTRIPIIGVFAAGVIHGLYSTGGPPLVWALGRANLDRNTFRGTMAAIWVIVTLLQGLGLFMKGSFTLSHLMLGVSLMPGTTIGTFIGSHLRNMLPERELRIFIYSMLAACGASLLR